MKFDVVEPVTFARFARFATFTTFAAITPACALLMKSEPVVPRYFSPEVQAPSGPDTGPSAGLEIKLGRVDADAYLGDRIVHRDSAFEIGYYDDNLWTEKPEAYVRRALARALFDERRVTQLLSGTGPTLDVDIVAFEEVRAPAHLARIELVFVVYDDRVVRLSRSVVVERPIVLAKGDFVADHVVTALSSALLAAVDAVADAATAELRTEATSADGAKP
jgi:cholesterol transport system auxiliary component